VKPRPIVAFVAGLVLLNVIVTKAAPIKLTLTSKGTNQVEFTFGPVVPGAYYQVLARTNSPEGHWMAFTRSAFVSSNENITALCDVGGDGELKGLTAQNLQNWSFVAGSWEDSDGDGLPDLYEELVTHTDPNSGEDGYADPDGDGWSNIQELTRNTDPLKAELPAGPTAVQVSYRSDGVVQLSWRQGVTPDYFEIERSDRTAQWNTNWMQSRIPPNRAPFTRGTNVFQNRTNFSRRPFPARTNANPNIPPPSQTFPNRQPLPGLRNPPYSQIRDRVTVITNAPRIIARVAAKADVHDYQWLDTNAHVSVESPEPGPLYRVRAHFTSPLGAELQNPTASTIGAATHGLSLRPTTNGYDLTLTNPIPYFRYLLLVRDRNDSQWRAAGYFTSGTNRNPVHVQVNSKGMMTSPQSPIALPQVLFVTNVVEPQFIAGPGDDSDGDGLPDVYEVFVTKTDSLKTDTGYSGVIDGFKELTSDGWSNLEKLRRRIDPLRPFHPPEPRVLPEPTLAEATQTLGFRSDLLYQPKIEIRIPGSDRFHELHRAFWLLYELSGARDSRDRACFDLRVSWMVPQLRAVDRENEVDAYGALAFSSLRAEALREGGRSVVSGPTNRVASRRSEVETYAASNPHFGPAIDYFLATIDGHQPPQLPSGLNVREIEPAVLRVFPNATNVLDRPIRFYGKVLDENERPASGFKVHFEWSGVLLHGNEKADAITDAAGLFSLTNAFGTRLAVSVENSNYYASARNRGNGSFQYVDSGRLPFTPDPNHPILFYFHKKGVGARTLVTSQYGVYTDLSVKPPMDGTPVQVNLLERKTGNGPLQISQIKPPHANYRTPTNWSLTLKLPGGGFVSGGDEEFPFHPPESGYQSEVNFNFDKGQTNWTPGIQKNYYIQFGDPPLYGRLRIETDISRDSVHLNYCINPDGARNLEPPNENTPTKAPTPFVASPPPLKPKILFTNASGQVVVWGSMVLPFVKAGTRFTAIAAGGEHSLAVKEDGTVAAWGRNVSWEAKVPLGLSNVVAVSAGGRSGSGFSVALRRDGTVIAWGDNSSGQTNVPPGLSDVIAISAGMDHCLALKKDGTVTAWGSNGSGKTEVPAGLSNVVAVAAAGDHSVALKRDGIVVAWGKNQWGKTVGPEGLSNVLSVSCGSDFGLALEKDGSVVEWGQPFSKETDIPKDLTSVVQIAAGPWNGAALKRDGTVTEWGRETISATHVPPGLQHVVAVSCGGNDQGGHTLALKTDGTIIGWGNNNYGQSLPPGGLTDVVFISGGEEHYLALRKDGSVVGWGGGEHQENGAALVPPDLGPVKQVAAGWSRSLALRTDGTVAGWGDHFFGLTNPAPGVTDISAVSSAIFYDMALKKNGSVVIWSDSPATQGQIFSNAIAIADAPHHCIALRQDGKVLSYGADGTLAVPAPEHLTNVIAIAAWGDPAFDHDLALRRNGTVFTWGSRGPVHQTEMPEQLTNVIAIAAGACHSLALRRDGTVVAWGANVSGQIAVPEGLSNVIAIAGGGASSAAIVLMPQPRSQLTGAIGKVVIVGPIVLLATGCLWLLRRRAT
jgi:alpha-tubulin suppressor-like RCC1 family protein